MASTGETNKVVAVTGASGYLGSHVVKCLIETGGFTVRGAVRDPTAQHKVAHLEQFECELFKADLLEVGSFDECFNGCDIVIHCASPFQNNVEDPQRDLIDPALNGTKNVIDTAVKCGVKRVVVTSSCAAVQTQDTFRRPQDFIGKIFTEEDWNDESTLEEGAYRKSKSMAEHAAWEYKEQIEITTINPAFILGPPISKRLDSVSVRSMVAHLSGENSDGVRASCFGCCDVRDVALAHVRAATHPEAPGKRFIVSTQDSVDQLQMVHFLLPEYKDYPIPMKFKDGETVKYRGHYSNDRAREILGVKMRPLGITISDMAADLVKKGLVQPPTTETEEN